LKIVHRRLLPLLALLLAARAHAAPGDISTFAGTGSPGDTGDGGLAVSALLRVPSKVAFDPTTGSILVADTGNDRVRRIAPDGTIHAFAGTGVSGFAGDDGPAVSAQLRSPQGVAVDSSGNVYIADTGSERIRKVDASGTITTYAGNGLSGSAGDGGAATAARLNTPRGLAVGADGALYVADSTNNKVRVVDAGGTITTFAGTGAVGYMGDEGPATLAKLSHPVGVAVDAAGRVYIADRGNDVIRRVDSGIIDTFAGNGMAGYSGDTGPGASARLASPSDVAVTPADVVFIADANNHVIRRVDAAGVITTFAGTGVPGYTGDGGPAASATLRHPIGVVVDPTIDLLIADENNHAIRSVATRCGNGILDADEDCDLGAGNGSPTTCCTSACVFRANGAVCRAATDLCDIADACDGASALCGADVIASAGTVCRAAGDVCDLAEECDGLVKACPADLFASSGTLCRAAGGVCDVAENCTGSGIACPADAKAPPSQLCRGSAGVCDPAEFCTGSANGCPADSLTPAGTECRAAAGLCDVAEACTGAAVDCPADAKRPAGFVCRPSTGDCDPQETCDGSSNACPAELPFPDEDADSVCDAEDNCFPLANPGQEDGDVDGVGDACDNCAAACNPDQTDTDGDASGGDACDACPDFAQAGQSPACASAGPASALACCLPAGSAARPVDQEGDACSLGGPSELVSADGSNAVRVGVGAATAPTSVAATALTRGAVAIEAASALASVTRLTPANMSFAAPLAVCLKWPDAEPDGIADGSGLAAVDLRPTILGAGGAHTAIAARCADQACGALDVSGFPTDWGTPGVRSDDESLRACCDLAESAWCFEATSLGTFGIVDAPCPSASGEKIKLARLTKPTQSLTLSGEVQLPFPFSPPLDPVARGVHVRITDGSGVTLLETQIPPGAFSSVTGEGWTLTASGTTARWRSRATVDGLHLVKLGWKPGSSPGKVSFQVKGKAVVLPVDAGDLPLHAQVRLDAPEALTGQCASVAFPGPPAGIGCLISGTGTSLTCR
jgi:sugar lactone lactonase YvrE